MSGGDDPYRIQQKEEWGSMEENAEFLMYGDGIRADNTKKGRKAAELMWNQFAGEKNLPLP